MEKPSTSELSAVAGISKSYASEILSGQRKPSRPVAIHIFRATGWRHALIADLSEDDMVLLERIEPFQPREAADPSTDEARAA